ncbi:unnamed protein product [Lathyrus oleraceus]|uniref:CCHC-type domain-containing protein n=1 Tax=Pisum sativum TaxID=3888 RepID=A0A9D5AAA8_PEA|nr:uncharacterized protein LOC127093551 [Pisum sativum]KAI5400463.1 hypothetical protein KIW84_065374 [Pisum sativum]
MVNQRQRLAKKRFKAENPELFPKPEPTPPKDPSKKKKNKFKRKKPDSKDKPRTGKRPLRVPGMKPGDSCFICKGLDHIAKFCTEKAEWERNKICLRCRRRGHRAQNCPDGSKDVKFCYNCGDNGHSLANCPYPLEEGGTKFAECFVCNEQGHLSKNCPKNANGIYPKGGCCKLCGGVTHLAKDCPDKGKNGFGGGAKGAVHNLLRTDERPKGQVTKFVSGDDMDDDFTTQEIKSDEKNKSAKSKDGSVKPKKGPKIVNFD